MKSNLNLLLICSLLQAMFAYTLISKLAEFPQFQNAMRLQPIPTSLSKLLAYLLPFIEAIAVILLFHPLQKFGLLLSTILLAAFSIYIALGILGLLGKMPCSCGGILGKMALGYHLAFNLFFLSLSLFGTYVLKRKEVGKI